MAADVGWGRRVLALAITLFGLLVAGTLIGVIAAGVEERIDRMRRARSAVFETGHVVILGASDRLPLLIQQLVLARAHRRSSVLVVMADRDPTELQESVRRVVHDRKGSRLVFRSGDPTHPPDLGLTRLREAEMVIVLGDEAAGDPRAIRTVVAVAAELQGLDPIPIVVELEEPASADRLTRVYGSHVHPLVPRQAVTRIAAVALREPGAGQVAIALLDDLGSDIHVSQASSLQGQISERLAPSEHTASLSDSARASRSSSKSDPYVSRVMVHRASSGRRSTVARAASKSKTSSSPGSPDLTSTIT